MYKRWLQIARSLRSLCLKLRRSSALRKITLKANAFVIKANALVDSLAERMLNIDTVSLPETIKRNTRYGDSVHHESVPYIRFWRLTRQLKITEDDVVYDIGCGMGRILCVFARKPVKKCVGIEVSSKLAERGRQNAARLRGRKALIEIRVSDAVEADYSEGTIYCMFHPFGAKTLRVVLERIRESLRNSPRRIRIAYFEPIHEDLLSSSGWLECYKRKELILGQGIDRVSYWTTKN